MGMNFLTTWLDLIARIGAMFTNRRLDEYPPDSLLSM
jgi:hypothetical protein